MKADYFINQRLKRLIKTGESSLSDSSIPHITFKGDDNQFLTSNPDLKKAIRKFVPDKHYNTKRRENKADQMSIQNNEVLNAISDFVKKVQEKDIDLGFLDDDNENKNNQNEALQASWEIGAPVAGSAAGTTLGASVGGVPGAIAGGLGGAGLGYISSNEEAPDKFQEALKNLASKTKSV